MKPSIIEVYGMERTDQGYADGANCKSAKFALLGTRTYQDGFVAGSLTMFSDDVEGRGYRSVVEKMRDEGRIAAAIILIAEYDGEDVRF